VADCQLLADLNHRQLINPPEEDMMPTTVVRQSRKARIFAGTRYSGKRGREIPNENLQKIMDEVQALKAAAESERSDGELRFKVVMGARLIGNLIDDH
jgi:hypothetical protein